MNSISISRAKTWRYCPLKYKYTYETKFVPTEQKPIYVQAKGLVLHQTFENLLKYENYKEETPCLPYRKASDKIVLGFFKKAMEENKLPITEAKEYNLKLGLKRWLSFKHDFLDKNNHIMYSEKQYNEYIFGNTKTITILDLLEDCGDGNYIIYDYKTPQTIDANRYKEQLVLYAYVMACVKGIINKDSEEFEKVVNHFKLFVFFPLAKEEEETYEKFLKPIKYTVTDIKKVLEDLKKSCDEIDGFNFNQSAEVLQLTKPGFMCKWCDFYGSNAQPDIGFEGCPITHFMGIIPINGSFKKKE